MAATDTHSMPAASPIAGSVSLLVTSVALVAAAAAGCDASSKQQQQTPAPNAATAGGSSGEAEANQGPVSVVIALKPGATPGKPSVTVGGKPAGGSLNAAVGNALKAMP